MVERQKACNSQGVVYQKDLTVGVLAERPSERSGSGLIGLIAELFDEEMEYMNCFGMADADAASAGGQARGFVELGR